MRRIVRRVLTPPPPKRERLIEEEVAPGTIVFRPRLALAVLAALLGFATSLGPVVTSPWHGAAAQVVTLPPGRRRDPTL